MTSFTRRACTAAIMIVAMLAAAGCAELPASEATATCAADTGWFDRQRQLADGHADPYAAAVDGPCRAAAR